MKKVSRLGRTIIAVLIMVFIIATSFAVIFYGFYQVYFAPATLFSRDFQKTGTVEEYFSEKVINVALLGLHNRSDDNTFGEIYNVDTLLVLSLNFDRNHLTILAVPRDTYTVISCSGKKDKLRNAYREGYLAVDGAESSEAHDAGLKCAHETAAALLEGLPLDYYLAIDLNGVRQLIDAVGGVYFEVEKPLKGPTARESLKAGPQLLTGQGFVTYLTYIEHDWQDDFNRIMRQKKLLRYTFRYFKDKGLFNYVVPMYAAYRDHIRTNLNFNQVAALALFAGEHLDDEALASYSLTGRYFKLAGDDSHYLELDEEYKKELLQRLKSGAAEGE